MTEHHEHHEGPAGNCICVKCNITIPHKRGVPCKEERCQQCGHRMMREGSEHHQKYLKGKDKESK